VVVPFGGDRRGAERLANALRRLRLRADDELVVADNTADGVASAVLDGAVTVGRATGERSSYHARNAGSRLAGREWLLFMDADCTPAPGLLDAYFEAPIPERCGALAGRVVADPDQTALVARYSRSRRFLELPPDPHGKVTVVTGNLLVRRSAFERIGGFVEGVRSGGDIDFCRRLQAAGFAIELRPSAVVEHSHRERLLPYLAIVARYAAGARWLNARYPGSAPRWPLPRELGRAAGDAARLWLRGDVDEATFRAIDGLSLVAHNVGYRQRNRAGDHPGPHSTGSDHDVHGFPPITGSTFPSSNRAPR
jgi:glycosyltransferase involved in cell wall biosynthesis